ncbi:MAG: hypothetical protein K2L74_04500 [Muribaculaceae bacterium]|nr:hypothetical protein [Muribaculaceae bacterium]
MKTSDKIAKAFSDAGSSLKSIAKIALLSRRCTIGRRDAAHGDALIILGNGPSLRQTIERRSDALKRNPSLAVNFAANTAEFSVLRPKYYVMADPHFFRSDEPNVCSLWRNLSEMDWPMTLYVPSPQRMSVQRRVPNLKVEGFNAVGADGWRWLRHAAYRSGLAMPRPRNVLIPSIMIAIKAGFRRIYLVGADHSWLKTLSVGDDNAVLSIQPHFYEDDKRELARSATEYRGYRLHEVLGGFTMAFRSYHQIAEYAAASGVQIFNSTPESFIDAFERREIDL